MSDAQSYFSLVQYGENVERAEYVNVGVVLFLRAAPYVVSKFVAPPRRIRRAAFFREEVDSMRLRILTEFAEGWTLEAVSRFIETRAGNLRLLPPRSVFAEHPLDVVDDLYAKLVSSRA